LDLDSRGKTETNPPRIQNLWHFESYAIAHCDGNICANPTEIDVGDSENEDHFLSILIDGVRTVSQFERDKTGITCQERQEAPETNSTCGWKYDCERGKRMSLSQNA
jgi:hypothetical protein